MALVQHKSRTLIGKLSSSTRPLQRLQHFSIYNSKSPKSLKYYAATFSYVGASILFTIITYTYCQFGVQTSVDITRPRQTELPAVALCFYLDLPSLKIVEDDEGYQVTNITIGELNNLIPSWNQFVIDCQVRNKFNKLEKCERFLQNNNRTIVEYISKYSKCFNLFESLPEPINYIRKLTKNDWLVNILLNTSALTTDKIGMFMTPTNIDLQESLGNPSFLEFDIKEHNHATVSFAKTVIETLPQPYSTKCFDYETLPCQDRPSCVKQCLLEKSYKHNKRWFSHWYVPYKREWNDGKFSTRPTLEFYDLCFDEYSQTPCKTTYTRAILTSVFKSPYQPESTFRITIAYPMAPQDILYFIPKQLFQSYLCFLASILALWTQVSAIKLTNCICMFVEKFYSKLVNRKYFKFNDCKRENAKRFSVFKGKKLIIKK